MKREEIRTGETYLLPVTATYFADRGNMLRVITEDEGSVVYVHPEALRPQKKTIELLPVKGGRK